MKNKEENPKDEFMFAKMLAGEVDCDKLNTDSEEEKLEKKLKWLYVIFIGLLGGMVAPVFVWILEGEFTFWLGFINLWGSLSAVIAATVYFFFLTKKNTVRLKRLPSFLLSLILFLFLQFGVPFLVVILSLFSVCKLGIPIMGGCPL